MAFLYKNKANGLTYTIEHLKQDIRFLNAGGLTGIYARPFLSPGEPIIHLKDMAKLKGEAFNPEKFVEDNFEIIAEIHSM